MRVIVLGAGPAGASAAVALADKGVDTLLVDPRPHTGWQLGEGLPAAAGEHLRSLGVWEAFRGAGHLPCTQFVSCWGAAEPAYRSAIVDAHGPSWQVERRRFDEMLVTAARTAGADGPVPWRLTGIRRGPPRWLLRCVDDGTVRVVPADFVIDGTGRRSCFARLLGLPRRVDSSVVCAAGLLDDPDPDDGSSLVETVEDGWWYASRVPGGRLVVAKFTDAAISGRQGLRRVSEWSRQLGRTRLTRARAGWPGLRLRAPLRIAAAGSSALDSPAATGWLAVGDAACAHDPLSSRGLHDALATGIAGADAVALTLDGAVEAAGRYADTVSAGYRRYLRELAWFYAEERRFPAAQFWRSRASADG
jgi:flavin-dependent dehydrogenase